MAEQKRSKVCSIENCERKTYRKGMCRPHSLRVELYGDPMAGRTPNGEAKNYYKSVVLNYRGDDCLIWPYTRNKKGYAMLNIGIQKIVSRLACEAINGPPPHPSYQAAHSCGNGYGGCVNPAHVRWATPAQNSEDRITHGTQVRGEMCSYRKLNENQVREIREKSAYLNYRELAEIYGVKRGTIGDIIRRKNWRHI